MSGYREPGLTRHSAAAWAGPFDGDPPGRFDLRDAAEAQAYDGNHHPWPHGPRCPDCLYRVDAPGHLVTCETT